MPAHSFLNAEVAISRQFLDEYSYSASTSTETHRGCGKAKAHAEWGSNDQRMRVLPNARDAPAEIDFEPEGQPSDYRPQKENEAVKLLRTDGKRDKQGGCRRKAEESSKNRIAWKIQGSAT